MAYIVGSITIFKHQRPAPGPMKKDIIDTKT